MISIYRLVADVEIGCGWQVYDHCPTSAELLADLDAAPDVAIVEGPYGALTTDQEDDEDWTTRWTVERIDLDDDTDTDAAMRDAEGQCSAQDVTGYISCEDVQTAPVYTAAIATDASCVTGEYCDVTVIRNEISGYRTDENGDEHPEYTLGNEIAMARDTDVRTDDDDSLAKVIPAAEAILRASGWTVVGQWDTAANALYARVERMVERI